MVIEHLILDFDGHITHNKKEVYEPAGDAGTSFFDRFTTAFKDQFGITNNELFSIDYEATQKEVLDDKTSAWILAGERAAPAVADYYLLATATLNTLHSKMKDDTTLFEYDKESLENTKMDEFMPQAYFSSYDPNTVFFREGDDKTRDYLLSLAQDHTIEIVTNSKTDAVEKKLEQLFEDSDVNVQKIFPVTGDAKKYVVNQSYENVSKDMLLPGAAVPTNLRREKYHKVLIDLEEKRNFKPHNTAVIGDVFELDLALPMHLGYTTIHHGLFCSPEYELALEGQSGFEKHYVTEKFDEVIDILKK